MSRTISQIKTVGDLKKIIANLDDNLEISVSADSSHYEDSAEISVYHNCLQISTTICEGNCGWISFIRLFHINPDYLT
jgi:hypothetical protein